MKAEDNHIYQRAKRRREEEKDMERQATTFALQYPPEQRGRMQRIYECVSRGRFLINESNPDRKIEQPNEVTNNNYSIIVPGVGRGIGGLLRGDFVKRGEFLHLQAELNEHIDKAKKRYRDSF